jgi:hypothetical protein
MTATFVFMTIGWILSFLVKARDLSRDPNNPYLRWLCIALGSGAVATASSIPPVLAFLERSTGVQAVWVIAPGMVGAVACRTTLFLCFFADVTEPLRYSPDEARRRIRSGLVLTAIAIAAVIILCLAGRGKVEDLSPGLLQTSATPRWGSEAVPIYGPWAATPFVRDAYLVFCVAFGLNYVSSAAILVAARNLVDRRWVLRTMWGFVIVCGFMVIHVSACAGFFVLYRSGLWLPELLGAAMVAVSLAVIVTLVSYLMPMLGPRWDRMAIYRRLEPLWSDLRRAFPEVVLEKPRAALLDAWNPWDSDFRLCRRVIEIRDGILKLRHYFSPDVAAEARRLWRTREKNNLDQEAIILAAQLTHAIRNKRDGRPPQPGTVAEVYALPRGNTLDAELALLLPLADAFATSEIVQEAAACSTEPEGETADIRSDGRRL